MIRNGSTPCFGPEHAVTPDGYIGWLISTRLLIKPTVDKKQPGKH